jgi:hypothetical protein
MWGVPGRAHAAAATAAALGRQQQQRTLPDTPHSATDHQQTMRTLNNWSPAATGWSAEGPVRGARAADRLLTGRQSQGSGCEVMWRNHTHEHKTLRHHPRQPPSKDPIRRTAAWELHNSKQEGHNKGDRSTTAAAHNPKRHSSTHSTRAPLYVWRTAVAATNHLLLPSLQCRRCRCAAGVSSRADA